MASAVRTEYIVLGIPVQNSNTAVVARQVVRVAIAMTIFVIIQNIGIVLVQNNSAGMFNSLLNTFIALLIPACGYFGAKQRDRSLMCCFCGCSAFNAVFLVWMTISYVSLASAGDSSHSSWEQALTIAALIISVLLYSTAYYLGNKLYNDESMFVSGRRPPNANVPVATVAYPAQPPRQHGGHAVHAGHAGHDSAHVAIPVATPVGPGGMPYGSQPQVGQPVYAQPRRNNEYPPA